MLEIFKKWRLNKVFNVLISHVLEVHNANDFKCLLMLDIDIQNKTYPVYRIKQCNIL